MRDTGTRSNDIDRIQAWAGQSGALARADSAQTIVRELWTEAKVLLGGA